VGGVISTLLGVYVCLKWYTFWHTNYKGELMTHGPYGKIRHPFYAGFLSLALGLALLFPILETTMLAIFSAAGILVFIPREEEYLLEQYGKEYEDYMKKVRWRILPRIF
jgi:protein-S-isoprenylcysteine O-methyltransferase Ste14